MKVPTPSPSSQTSRVAERQSAATATVPATFADGRGVYMQPRAPALICMLGLAMSGAVALVAERRDMSGTTQPGRRLCRSRRSRVAAARRSSPSRRRRSSLTTSSEAFYSRRSPTLIWDEGRCSSCHWRPCPCPSSRGSSWAGSTGAARWSSSPRCPGCAASRASSSRRTRRPAPVACASPPSCPPSSRRARPRARLGQRQAAVASAAPPALALLRPVVAPHRPAPAASRSGVRSRGEEGDRERSKKKEPREERENEKEKNKEKEKKSKGRTVFTLLFLSSFPPKIIK